MGHLANYCEVVKRSKRVKPIPISHPRSLLTMVQDHSLTHARPGTPSRMMPTSAYGRHEWSLVVDATRKSIAFVDCFLDCVGMGFKSDIEAIQTILRYDERSAVLRTGEIVQWGFTHQRHNIGKSGSGLCDLMQLLLQV